MIIWLDAQLPPALAPWIHANFGIEARALRDVGLRDGTDREIFCAARVAGAIVMTKDSDFRHIAHPTSGAAADHLVDVWEHVNRHLRELLAGALPKALALLEAGEPLVEISGA